MLLVLFARLRGVNAKFLIVTVEAPAQMFAEWLLTRIER